MPQRPQKRMLAGYAVEQRRQSRSACGGTEGVSVPNATAFVNDGVPGPLPALPAAGTFRPQRPQNREFGCSGFEHLGHGVVPGAGCVTSWKDPLPQRPQKRTPSANLDPQFEQATIPGITLDCACPELGLP